MSYWDGRYGIIVLPVHDLQGWKHVLFLLGSWWRQET
jgi:hypothetical protein